MDRHIIGSVTFYVLGGLLVGWQVSFFDGALSAKTFSQNQNSAAAVIDARPEMQKVQLETPEKPRSASITTQPIAQTAEARLFPQAPLHSSSKVSSGALQLHLSPPDLVDPPELLAATVQKGFRNNLLPFDSLFVAMLSLSALAGFAFLTALRRRELTDRFRSVWENPYQALGAATVWKSWAPPQSPKGRRRAKPLPKPGLLRLPPQPDLLQQGEFLRRAFDTAADAILIFDREGMIQSANASTGQLFGYAPAKLRGMPVSQLFQFDTGDQWLVTTSSAGQLPQQRQPRQHRAGYQATGRCSDGTTFPVDLTVSEWEFAGKRLFTWIIRDATARTYSEDLLASFGALLEQSLHELYVIDAETLKLVQVSRGVCNNLGYSPEELYQMTTFDYKPHYTAQQVKECKALAQKVLNGELDDAFGTEVHYRKDGSTYEGEYQVRLGRWRGKRCFIMVGTDVTERNQAQRQLAQLHRELERRVEERTRQLQDAQEQLGRQEKLALLGQIAGSVAHEIRNPISVIKNAVYFLQLAQESRCTSREDTFRETMNEMTRGVGSIERIVNELLDFGRCSEAEPDHFAINTTLESALQQVTFPDHVTVNCRQMPHLNLMVYADQCQIERVFINLLQNAIQAMSQGGALTLRCYRCDEEVVTEVIDSGIGIPEDALPKIFEPLYSTRAKGIGLGLALCRRYAEANGGTLVADSTEGEGSTFRLFLPLKAPKKEAEVVKDAG